MRCELADLVFVVEPGALPAFLLPSGFVCALVEVIIRVLNRNFNLPLLIAPVSSLGVDVNLKKAKTFGKIYRLLLRLFKLGLMLAKSICQLGFSLAVHFNLVVVLVVLLAKLVLEICRFLSQFLNSVVKSLAFLGP